MIALLHMAATSLGDLRARLEEAKIEAVYPNDQNYKALSRPYNLRFDYKAAAFAFPKTTADIATIVTAAGAEGIPGQPSIF